MWKLMIQFDDDSRFSAPRYFSMIKEVADASGLSNHSIRSSEGVLPEDLMVMSIS